MAFRATRIREEPPPDGHDVPEDESEESAIHAAIMAAVHETLGPGHRIVSAAPVVATPAAAIANFNPVVLESLERDVLKRVLASTPLQPVPAGPR